MQMLNLSLEATEVRAVYRKPEILEYFDNPMIEALPPMETEYYESVK